MQTRLTRAGPRGCTPRGASRGGCRAASQKDVLGPRPTLYLPRRRRAPSPTRPRTEPTPLSPAVSARDAEAPGPPRPDHRPPHRCTRPWTHTTNLRPHAHSAPAPSHGHRRTPHVLSYLTTHSRPVRLCPHTDSPLPHTSSEPQRPDTSLPTQCPVSWPGTTTGVPPVSSHPPRVSDTRDLLGSLHRDRRGSGREKGGHVCLTGG